MSRRATNTALCILLASLCSAVKPTAAQQKPQETKVKLAVLKITFRDVPSNEQEQLRHALHENLQQEMQVELMTEAEARQPLIAVGIEPAELNDEQGYINAARLLRVNYVLVGNVETIGNIVVSTFRVFPSPKGVDTTYEKSQFMDRFVTMEIPKIAQLITRDIMPATTVVTPVEPSPTSPDTSLIATLSPESARVEKKSKWGLLVLGGAVLVGGGITTAFILTTGEEPPRPGGLPRPPSVP